jgi:hypothetical protein
MSQKSLQKCRKNLTVDVKMWYSDIDCYWHWTVFSYEEVTKIHSNKSIDVHSAMVSIENYIASCMLEESNEVKSNF